MPKPIKEKYIEMTERNLDFTFPQEYRFSMIEENGGMVASRDIDWVLYPIADLTDQKSLAKTCNNISKETKVSRQWDHFPDKAIAIGEDGTGDKLIFLPKDSKPYHWFHETGAIKALTNTFHELEKIY